MKTVALDFRFVLFAIGLSTAAAASVVTIYLLCLSLLQGGCFVYEHNLAVAVIEIVFLTLATATCLIASEVYYRYLKLTSESK